MLMKLKIIHQPGTVLKRKNIDLQQHCTKQSDSVFCKACNINVLLKKYKVHLRTEAHKDNNCNMLKDNLYEVPLSESAYVKQYRIFSELKKRNCFKKIFKQYQHIY